MALDDDIAVLERAPLFGFMEREALRLIAFAAEHRRLKADQVLFRTGEASDGGYVVKEGEIALENEKGETLFVAGPSALIGRNALFTRGPRAATATARGAAGVMRVSQSLMRRVLEEFPAAAQVMHQAMAVELAALSGGLDRIRQRLAALDEGG
ncbi:MAG TPA: Crp/Fnr family transcriptional regulator [Beijerinckiaceae bacterium]|nr:Crp/Fnr family transcriptional regulator [Beijerinckiaceae bacterium]